MIPAFLADRENRKRRGEDENRVGASAMHGNFDFNDVDDDDFDEDEIVLEMKGGSAPPTPASPMAEAQAQIELERARASLAAEEQARKDAIAAQERQARIDKARGVQSQAYNSASDYARQQVGARGFDQGLINQYKLFDLYDSDIDNARMGIAEDDLNPMAAYNTRTTFNNALETALGTYRGDLRRQLNSIAPESIGYNTFADSADDLILEEILGSNRADALASIDAARARGQLNDTGYNRALSRLDQQGEAAMSDLQDLGLGVLSGYRDQLGTLRNNALTGANAADFSNPYDFSSFESMLGNRTSDLTNRMRGDIFRATEGQSFFDPSSIISSSGAVQGFYNPTSTTKKSASTAANPLLQAFNTQEENKNKNTATNGVF